MTLAGSWNALEKISEWLKVINHPLKAMSGKLEQRVKAHTRRLSSLVLQAGKAELFQGRLSSPASKSPRSRPGDSGMGTPSSAPWKFVHSCSLWKLWAHRHGHYPPPPLNASLSHGLDTTQRPLPSEMSHRWHRWASACILD